MHLALRIPEILLNIFGHCYTELIPGECGSVVDLAVLARTCRKFKEPALDVLWEELYDLSPLARCLPEICHLSESPEKHLRFYWQDKPYYSFSRPLKEVEWIALRGYTSRIRCIHASSANVDNDIIREIFSLASFDNPLFPHLRSLYWICMTTLSSLKALNFAVPSLMILHLNLYHIPLSTVKEFFDAFGDYSPHMETLTVHNYSSGFIDSTISGLVCRWPQLQHVDCLNVALSMDALSHLSSMSSLESLTFTVEVYMAQDISHRHSKLVFSDLTNLGIRTTSLDTVTLLLRSIRLPAIKALSVVTERYISKWAIQLYWAAVQETCSSNALIYLKLCGSTQEVTNEVPLDGEPLSYLTLDDLRPCTVFAGLRGLEISLECPVSLTDADLLQLVSPRMEYLLINLGQGWRIDAGLGGITLYGLVRLLRTCPSLGRLCLAIDTRTFTRIPEGLDVSFPPRTQLKINLLDSYIRSHFVRGLVSVFTTLGLGHSVLMAWSFDYQGELQPLWKSVLDALRDRERLSLKK